MTLVCGAFTRDRKNINKFALSHEKVLISGYGNGRLSGVFTARSRAFFTPQRSRCVATNEILLTCALGLLIKKR